MSQYYFDNSATTKPCEDAVEAVKNAAEVYGNPSSLHKLGILAENILKSSRKTIAASLGCDEKNIYFTSGGTESNNIAIIGTAYRKQSIGKHIGRWIYITDAADDLDDDLLNDRFNPFACLYNKELLTTEQLQEISTSLRLELLAAEPAFDLIDFEGMSNIEGIIKNIIYNV